MSPKKKVKLSVSDRLPENQCVFCGNKFSRRNKAIQAERTKLDNIFDCARHCRNQVSLTVLEYVESLREGRATLFYYRNCRLTFTSNFHVLRTTSAKAPQSVTSQQITHKRPSKSETSRFDVKKGCLICGKPCHDKRNT